MKVLKFSIDALLDSGCSRSIISPEIARYGQMKIVKQRITMMNGDAVVCEASCAVEVSINGVTIMLDCLVAEVLPKYKMLLGMDAIGAMGGVHIGVDGSLKFVKSLKSNVSFAAELERGSMEISDKDFYASFSEGKWTVEWKWLEGMQGPMLQNNVSQYNVSGEALAAFEQEVKEWIDLGWLQQFEGKHDGIIPLMAVIQINKEKVRPVLDYRELNQYVSSHTGTSDVCGEKLRKWRCMGKNVKMIDLRKAYLQIHLSKKLWKFQVVKFHGMTYCLTRLGFGLNVAPKIMSAIVNKVLSIDSTVRAGTDSYIDDIIVNESVISCDRVIELLATYGLQSKPAEPLIGSRILGLSIVQKNGETYWGRGNKVVDVCSVKTKRQVFGLCGQLLGHYPVAGWLRPACSFIKRSITELQWDDFIDDKTKYMLNEVINEVEVRDPVMGKWNVTLEERGIVWCDASSLAIGVCLELDGDVVEDAAWLRKPDDSGHINLAELEAVLKGVNLALRWDLKNVVVKTDSATVHAWVSSLLTQDRKIKTSGLGEALVRRRLGILRELIDECKLDLHIELVKSHLNKADRLTRVPKKWLTLREEVGAVSVNQFLTPEKNSLIMQLHSRNHFGVYRTLYLVRRCYPEEHITKQEVDYAIRGCKECLSIDPAPVHWEHGNLDIGKVWFRVACDITHYGAYKYLTLIDCGPSRFAIWRRVSDESLEHVTRAIEEVFAERGPPSELLLDNSRTFRSDGLQLLCQRWGVKIKFRCVNRPSGNGIIERNHRTIKRMAKRSGGSIPEMVYWYNFTPREMDKEESSPRIGINKYEWRCIEEPNKEEEGDHQGISGNFSIGQEVYIKPENARCTSLWKEGVVTAILSPFSVEVDGFPHHIADIRQVSSPERNLVSTSEEGSKGDKDVNSVNTRSVVSEDQKDDVSASVRKSGRCVRRPVRLQEYYLNDDVDIMGACGVCEVCHQVGASEEQMEENR